MTKVNINDLKSGMKFTEAVYITPSNILVGAEIPLNAKDLERLKKWGIKEVETSGEIIESSVETMEPGDETKESADKGKEPSSIDYSFDEKHTEINLQEELVSEYKKLHKTKHKFKSRYQDSVNSLKGIIDDVKGDRYLNNMKIFNISTDLISEVISNPHIFIYLASKMSDEKEYLAYHLLNAAIFSIMIGHLIKIDSKSLINLAAGALVFDIGMTKIPSAIVMKKEKLNPKELNIIKLHTIYGYKILIKNTSFPSEIAAVALQHHEQFDGNGYPRKLKSDQIDLFSRIVSISDTFEAMTKKRSYRNEFLSYEAMKNVLNQSKNKFDPKLIRIFLSNMSIYPVASLIKLNTNAIGMVIGTHNDKPLRPIIKIIIDEFGDKVPEEEERIVDLTTITDIYIMSAVDENEYNLDVYDLI